MKKILLGFFLLFFAVTQSAMAGSLILANANIINPSLKGSFEPRLGYIIIEKNRIQKIGYEKLDAPPNSYVVDVKKSYVIPGLIDTHNHIDMVLGVNENEYIQYSKLIRAYQNQLPHSYLYFGYMTIVDVATSDKDVIEHFNSNLDHPDLFTCGGGVTALDGYPMNYLPKKSRYHYFPNFFIEANQKNFPSTIDPKQQTPDAIMKRILDARAVCVKIFYESGYGGITNLPLPSLENVKALVKLAHEHNLPVLMHANSVTAQEFALAAGVDIIAHGLWSWGPDEGKSGLPAAVQKVLDEIIAKKVNVQPTIQVINGLLALIDPNFLNDPQLPKVVPNSLLDWYKTSQGQWYRNLIVGNRPPADIKKVFQTLLDQVNRATDYLQKHQGNLLFGTDTPSGPTYGNPPGYNAYLEMQNWYHAQIPLIEILRAATIRNAVVFHLDKEYGSIEVGKIAHLVIMNKNPLKDISAYDSITSVILHGQIHNRSDFVANKEPLN